MQDYLLFIDTETSGLPKKWDLPYCDNDNWPYALQVSWIVYTKDMQEVKREDHYIKDNDFTISPKAYAIHGLTQEYLVEHGEWRKDVMSLLANDLLQYEPLVVGHFIELDLNVAGVEFYRTGITNPLENLKTFCTMLATTKWVQNPKAKYLRLNQLYEVLFNKTLDRQHNALEDAEATAECFFEMLKRGDINDESIQHQEVYLQKIRSEKKYLLPAAIVLILIIIIAFWLYGSTS
ncbi:3'-5' exonuclease [Mucilaginibacter kameinonensis]|uniref:3'-5' exonuclease n=1 Tax=Mucilaginibacter kameinonensis TaxID=452286 RepID=UPI000EF82F8F|nr:3'-5' exonuclease [Mucilaginibacter kameinonensis]